jgi:hypothetical protein
MWSKIVDIINEIIQFIKDWKKRNEIKETVKEIKKVDDLVDQGKIDELNNIWKEDL